MPPKGGPGKDKVSLGTNPGDAQARSIRAKRRAMTVERLNKRERYLGHERALVQLGTRNTKILTGQEDLTEWSDEEIIRGQRKDKNGRWQGVRPKVVPKAVHDELVRRTLSRAQETMRENLQVAVEALVSIATGIDVDDKDKIKAISIIMERVMGKEPNKVEVSSDQPWMVAITAGIIGTEEDFGEGGFEEIEDEDL